MPTIHFIKIKFSPGRISMYKSDSTDRPADFQKDVIKLELSVSRIFHKVLNKGRLTEIFEKNDFEVLGNLLYKVICRNDDLRDFFLNGLNMTLRDKDSRARIIFEFEEEVADLAALPWEYILVQANPDKNIDQFYLGADRNKQFDLYRSVGHEQNPVLSFRSNPVLHLVTVISNPADKPVDEQLLRKKLETLRKRFPEDPADLSSPVFQDYFLDPDFRTFTADLRNIVVNLIKGEPYVVHFYGHAKMEDEEAAIGMVKDNLVDWRNARDFLNLLKDHDFDAPVMIVLQSCESGQINLDGRGLAIELAQGGIPAVVAMQNEVTEAVSCEFVEQFYSGILDGYDVARAVTQARWYLGCDYRKKGSYQYYNDNSFGTPILFISTTEPLRLIPVDKTVQEKQVNRKFICPNCGTTYDNIRKDTCARGKCNGEKLVDYETYLRQRTETGRTETVTPLNDDMPTAPISTN